MIRFSLFLLLLASPAFSQPSDYWQQHVSYQIEATLLDSIHSYNGRLSVNYTNNSPDTLHEVYFHLYFNAFRPGSMMYERAKVQNDLGLVSKFDRYRQSDWGGYNIKNVATGGTRQIIDRPASEDPSGTANIITTRDQIDSRFEVTGTIMKVTLAQPLLPKGTTPITIDYFAQVPRQTRRSGWMNDHGIKYSMCQWYPKVCEYDREGWHHQEYIGREFYGVWGEFDVKLTVPSKYCVGATGQCANPGEVGWGYDSIAKGVRKGFFLPTQAKQSGMTTWRFKAANVHDFAWVADDYIHEWDTWSDTVTVHCLYKMRERESWQQAMKHTFVMLEHHSKKVGWYQYRNFYNTHAGDGGMEYPQLIMDASPNAGLIMHEGAHQWFYGMLGNNETRYAFLDEGFTEFLEMIGMEAYYGRHNERAPYRDTSWLTKTFIPEYDSRRNYYSSYLDLASSGYEEPLNIPHDWAREGVNAGQVYFKTLNGLAQLEYVLGDSIFWTGMKEYFRRWHFKHPNLNDFKRTMEDVSGADLDWYFDQWFHTTRTIDYAGGSVESALTGNGTYGTTVKLCNRDLGVMPIDLTLHYEDGTTGIATIPVALNQGTAYKKPEPGRIFFTPWDWVKKEYTGTAITPKAVSWYEIDTSYRLMDLNKENNGSTALLGLLKHQPDLDIAFLKQYHNYPSLSGLYTVYRPLAWYDEIAGLNLGVGALFGNHRKLKGDIKVLYTARPVPVDSYADRPEFLDHIGLELRSEVQTKILGNLTTAGFNARSRYGMLASELSLDHKIRPTYRYLGPSQSVKFYLAGTFRGRDSIHPFPLYGGPWSNGLDFTAGSRYAFTSSNGLTTFGGGLEIGHITRYKQLLNPLPNSSTSFTKLHDSYTSLDVFVQQRVPLADGWTVFLKGNAMGIIGTPPLQKLYYLNGANPSQQEKSTFWKAITNISRHFSDQAHFLMEGGGGVRGYRTSVGNPDGGLGLSGEFEFPNPLGSLGWLPYSFQPLFFVDAGYAQASEPLNNQEHTYTDAGIGFRVNVLSWLPWQLQGVAEEYADIPRIGIYFPFYLSHPDDGKPKVAFRYVISLGTTF
jgi:hypothetical protein